MSSNKDGAVNRKYGAMLSICSMVVSLCMGVVYTPFAIRLLGQSEYAISNLAASVISYLSILDLGFSNTLVRYSARNRAKGEDDSAINGLFLLFYIIIGVVALLIGIILGLNIEGFFSGGLTAAEAHTLSVVFWILLINTVITFPLSAIRAIINSHEKFIFLSGVSIVANVLHHAANTVFLIIGYKAIGMAVISLVFSLIVGGLHFAPLSGHRCVCRRTLGGGNGQRFNQSLSVLS